MYYSTLLFYIFTCIASILLLSFIRNKNVAIIIVTFFLAVFLGLRNSLGNDYEQYVNIFYYITVYRSYNVIEPGYYFLNQLSYNYFGLDGYYFVFFFCALVTYFFVLKKAKKNDTLILTTLFMFLIGFVFFANNAIRQAATIAILFYSIDFLDRKKLIFIALSLFSTLFFHYSALFYLILLFVPSRTVSTKVCWIGLFVAFILYEFDSINLLSQSIVSYVPVYGEIYLSRVIEFKNKETGSGLVVLFFYIIWFFAILYKDKLTEGKAQNIFIWGGILYLSAPQIEMWERIMIPYFYYSIYAIPSIIKGVFKQSYLKFIIVCIFVAVFSFLFTYQILNNNNKNGISPFDSLIFGKMDQ